MASLSCSSESFFDPNLCGAWERVYWGKGSDAAMEHCQKKVSRIEALTNVLKRIGDLFVSGSVFKEEISVELECYHNTLRHYQKDQISLDLRNQLLTVSHIGRGEPGRTPFNYPHFQKRFYFEDELFKHVSNKMIRHERAGAFLNHCLSLPQLSTRKLRSFASSTAFSFKEKALLNTWKSFHLRALSKWNERFKILQNEPDRIKTWLVFAKSKTPLERMKLDSASQQNTLVQTPVAVVIEGGVDETHTHFAGLVENHVKTTSSPLEMEHGTFVSGIISLTVPSAHIKVYSDESHLTEEPESIINFSGWFPGKFSSLIDQPKLLCQHVKHMYGKQSFYYKELKTALKLPSPLRKEAIKVLDQKNGSECAGFLLGDLRDSLLIQAIGNSGVLLDQNEIAEDGHYWISSSPARLGRSIFVVNLEPNGFYPALSSCLPGAKYAANTICAIGTDVYSTVPEDQFAYQSGSSFAAPFVTSTALLIRGKYPLLSLKKVRQCILQSASSIILDESGKPRLIENPLHMLNYSLERIMKSREIYGMGLLNADRALKVADQLMLRQSRKKKWNSPTKKQRTP